MDMTKTIMNIKNGSNRVSLSLPTPLFYHFYPITQLNSSSSSSLEPSSPSFPTFFLTNDHHSFSYLPSIPWPQKEETTCNYRSTSHCQLQLLITSRKVEHTSILLWSSKQIVISVLTINPLSASNPSRLDPRLRSSAWEEWKEYHSS